MPVHGAFGDSIPAAQDHLDLIPARLVAIVANIAGTLAVVAVAIVTIRRRPLGNGLILAGVAVAALAPLYPAWVRRKRRYSWQLQHFFFTEVLQPLPARR